MDIHSGAVKLVASQSATAEPGMPGASGEPPRLRVFPRDAVDEGGQPPRPQTDRGTGSPNDVIQSGLALTDQALCSAANFLSFALVGRVLGDEGLGVYSLGVTVAFLMLAVQQCLVSAPYTVFAARLHGRRKAAYAGSTFLQLLLVCGGVSGVSAVAAGVLLLCGAAEAASLAGVLAAALPFLLLRDYGRRHLFAHLRVGAAVIYDAVGGAAQMAALIGLAYTGRLTPGTAFLALAAGNIVVCLPWLAATMRTFRFSRRRLRRHAASNWMFGRWAFGARTVSVLTGYAPHWLLAGLVGVAATGVFSAYYTLVMAVNPLRVAMENLLAPKTARAFRQHGAAGLARLVWTSTFWLGGAVAIAGVGLIAGGDFVVRWIYVDEAFGGHLLTLTLLALGAVVDAVTVPADNGLRAMNRAGGDLSGVRRRTRLDGRARRSRYRPVRHCRSGRRGAGRPTAASGVVARGVSGGDLRRPPQGGRPMTWIAKPIAKLSSEELLRWNELLCANPALVSPFFRPEYAQIVAKSRADVEVAVHHHRGEITAFWPFQRQWRTTARPVGGSLCDFQGPISAGAASTWEPAELLSGCQLRAWDFDHLYPADALFADHCWTRHPSPFIDLSRGFEAYAVNQRQARRREPRDTQRVLRRIAQTQGEVTFCYDDRSPDTFEALRQWKSDQYRRTLLIDLFSYPWIIATLRNFWDLTDGPVRGLLSSLRVDGKLVAVHLGLLTPTVLHAWFPAYHVSRSELSPGRLLYLHLFQEAAARGVRRVDFALGDSQFKRSWKSGADEVAEGTLRRSGWASLAARGLFNAKQVARQSPLRTSAGTLYRKARIVLGYE
jgi:CelD/BcsL family acetyltransferase involved in cellulose biosynthesis/O-antigen/teichoic acid export membrane protein